MIGTWFGVVEVLILNGTSQHPEPPTPGAAPGS